MPIHQRQYEGKTRMLLAQNQSYTTNQTSQRTLWLQRHLKPRKIHLPQARTPKQVKQQKNNRRGDSDCKPQGKEINRPTDQIWGKNV